MLLINPCKVKFCIKDWKLNTSIAKRCFNMVAHNFSRQGFFTLIWGLLMMPRGIPAISMHARQKHCFILLIFISRYIIFSVCLWRFFERSLDALSATLSLLCSKLFSFFSWLIFMSMFCNFLFISLFSLERVFVQRLSFFELSLQNQ